MVLINQRLLNKKKESKEILHYIDSTNEKALEGDDFIRFITIKLFNGSTTLKLHLNMKTRVDLQNLFYHKLGLHNTRNSNINTFKAKSHILKSIMDILSFSILTDKLSWIMDKDIFIHINRSSKNMTLYVKK